MSQHERLIAITLCLKEAAESGDQPQLTALLEEREQIIGSLKAAGQPLSPEKLAALAACETIAMDALRARRSEILGRLREVHSSRNVRKAYRAA